MKLQRFKEVQVAVIAVSFVLAVGILGCSSIQLVAPYDQKTDNSVTSLQTDTATFLTSIERQGGSTPEDYKKWTQFYDKAKVTLSGMLVRSSALAFNSLTVGQLEILRQQFQTLEEQHQKIGIPLAAVPQLESAFNRTFRAILTFEIAKKAPQSGGSGNTGQDTKSGGDGK
jgi:hypothetical protein